MSTALIQLVPTLATQISSWNESTSTTMKHREENTSREPSWSTSNQAQWTPFDLERMDRSSDQITLYLVSVYYTTLQLIHTCPL